MTESTITRFVEDLSRKTRTPTLGRSGYRLSVGDTHKFFYEDEEGGIQAAYQAAVEELPRLTAKIQREREATKLWKSLSESWVRDLRRRYNTFDALYETYPSVAHYALALQEAGELPNDALSLLPKN